MTHHPVAISRHPPRSRRVDVHLTVILHGAAQRVPAIGTNLSASGMFVETTSPLATDQNVAVELDLGRAGLYFIGARVARVEPGRGIGLHFGTVPEELRLKLVRLVAVRREELSESSRLAARKGSPRTADLPRKKGASERSGLPLATRQHPQRTRSLPTIRAAGSERAWLLLAGFMATTAITVVTLVPRPFASATPAPIIGPPHPVATAALVSPPIPRTVHLPDLAAEPVVDHSPAPTAAIAPAVAPVSDGWLDGAVARLQELGDRRWRAGDWSLPASASALDAYRDALALDPTSPDAIAGIARICDGYVARAAAVLAAGDVNGARWRLTKVIGILVEPATGQRLRDHAERTARAERLLAELDRPDPSR